ncbi:MAG: hypothetical protein JOZ52_05880 [Acidobacteria bacterium]|nr:hypothetical protein [Acidobacteriota bacterium]
MFESLTVKDPRPIAWLKRALTFCFICFLVIGVISSHRAYFQVRSLELRGEHELRAGSIIEADVVSSGRTYVDVQLELRQDAQTESLGTLRVMSNKYAFFDPRTQTGSLRVVLTPLMLARFHAGAAELRATAYGHSQWMRVPPPVSRRLDVLIQTQ